jgi:hypothetical protein
MSTTPECERCKALEAELIDVLQDAFYELAEPDEDGWYDTMASGTAVSYAERLCELGVFERDKSLGCGRRQWYRPIAKAAGNSG